MSEQITSPEGSQEEIILHQLRVQAFDHLTDDIDPDLANAVRELLQKKPDFRQDVRLIIGSVIERDWYDKAANIAETCGLSDSEFREITNRYKPNPQILA